MRSALGVIVFGTGVLAGLVFGGWALVLDLRLVSATVGTGAAVLAGLLFPLTYLTVPWYALVARGDWTPLLVGYGGGLLALALLGAGSAVVVSHLGTTSGYGKPRRRLPFLRS